MSQSSPSSISSACLSPTSSITQPEQSESNSTIESNKSISIINQDRHINEPPQHSEFILNGLKSLKSNKILCDVTLIAESKSTFLFL